MKANFWLTFAILGAGTFLIRLSAIALANKISISDKSKKLLSYIPIAVLPALIITMISRPDGVVEMIGRYDKLLIAAIVSIIAIKVKNTLGLISVGLLLLFILQQF